MGSFISQNWLLGSRERDNNLKSTYQNLNCLAQSPYKQCQVKLSRIFYQKNSNYQNYSQPKVGTNDTVQTKVERKILANEVKILGYCIIVEFI